MDLNTVKERIKEFITKSTFIDGARIDYTTMIFKEGILDSMGLVSLIAFLEEEYKISTDDTDLVEENFETIDAIAAFIGRKSDN